MLKINQKLNSSQNYLLQTNILHFYLYLSILLQFYFEVVDHLDSPEFIDPTPPHRQLFEIFVGAKFSIDVFARPTDMNKYVC